MGNAKHNKARSRQASGRKSIDQKQVSELQLLLRISRQIAAIDTLDELLQTIVEISCTQTGAERGTLFLHDKNSGELYSRIVHGGRVHDMRLLATSGVAGHVFTTRQGVVIDDAYADPRFDPTIDRETGYKTQTLVCAPIRTAKGEIIGVLQMLNKKRGRFTQGDLRLLEAMAEQSSITLRSTQNLERIRTAHEHEMMLLDVIAEITSEFDLGTMLSKTVGEAARMLQAERATLFLNDEKTGELFSRVAMGGSVGEIRMPNDVGIAGAVFTSGQTVNIPYAYADLRFNPAFDRKTGYFTRSILCVPIVDKSGDIIGVTQVLNKKGGPFTHHDEIRLKAFTAQLAISLQSAKLFDDVQNMKNYNESMLESMSNGVVTLNEDGRILTCNRAGLRILRTSPQKIINNTANVFFTGSNSWILDRIKVVDETLRSDISIDGKLVLGGENVSVNLTVLPLMREQEGDSTKLGAMLMIEDISVEKRMKSAMSRYMDPALADRLLAQGEDLLGGKTVTATVLFSDIRNFTGLAEEVGAHGTVALLNDYFTIMVDCIQQHEGMLDKFIGDAIMAVFGLPVAHPDDPDRAVRAAITMIRELRGWNADRVEAGKVPIDIGVGINTDLVVSGNIGSPKRMDYTIIGDGVNLASRLESACKQYSARILISENTYRKLHGVYRIREVDQVVVKNRQEPVTVFEVLDYHTEETFPNLMEAVEHFNNGLFHYRNQRWDKAATSFREAMSLNCQDKLPQIYIDRCAHLKENAPGDDWKGVWILKTK